MGFIKHLLKLSSRMGSGSGRKTDLHPTPCFLQLGIVKELLNGKDGNTMFPQDWSAEKIMDEIDSAWEKRRLYKDNRQWIGESKSGVTIRGYVSPRKTAFPEYKHKDK
jgi:hypothetical protein